MKDIIKQIHEQAQLLGQCGKFTGNEDLNGLIELFRSPQGEEFCLKHQFPSLNTFAMFKPFNVHEKGVFINFGGLVISDKRQVVLVGRTSATINCTENVRYEILLLHGAKAVVNAHNWAVVAIHAGKGCEVIKNVSGNAVVL
jgi:hypothetical protein